MVVEGEVVAGNGIDAGSLLDLPVLQTKSLTLAEEILTRELSTPVSFGGLLQVTELSHAGETKDRADNCSSEAGIEILEAKLLTIEPWSRLI